LLDVQANTDADSRSRLAMCPDSKRDWGLYFAHPIEIFSLGKIDRDQVAGYHETQGDERGRGERWSGQKTLNYDPGNSSRTVVARNVWLCFLDPSRRILDLVVDCTVSLGRQNEKYFVR